MVQTIACAEMERNRMCDIIDVGGHTANAHVEVSWLVAARGRSHFDIWMSDGLCQSLWRACVSEHTGGVLFGHPIGFWE